VELSISKIKERGRGTKKESGGGRNSCEVDFIKDENAKKNSKQRAQNDFHFSKLLFSDKNLPLIEIVNIL
jgi:hypothetical protein